MQNDLIVSCTEMLFFQREPESALTWQFLNKDGKKFYHEVLTRVAVILAYAALDI